MPLPRIAIATGDPAGIGPEIALKAAINANVRALCRPLLVATRWRSNFMRVAQACRRPCTLSKTQPCRLDRRYGQLAGRARRRQRTDKVRHG